MTFVYDDGDTPLQNAKNYVGYMIQTIQNHPENASLARIEKDLQKLSKILTKIK